MEEPDVPIKNRVARHISFEIPTHVPVVDLEEEMEETKKQPPQAPEIIEILDSMNAQTEEHMGEEEPPNSDEEVE